QGFFRLFNRTFDATRRGYGRVTTLVVHKALVMLVIYAGILVVGYGIFRAAPTGFIPQQDRGFLIVASQLPPGSSLARTDEVQRRAAEIALATPGVAHAINIVGFSGASFTNAPNAGAMFLVLDSFQDRARDLRLSAAAIQGA